ncbi:unnamed protein product [Effrenium voratum]|uniref:Uncharacterized protein n=1 Tax=Effrenium voratum TaxID=2562239 RepID=A0AA36JK96_9DINO|nr:unnamed protein product [Effrenium voratum]CAJ1434994.1 unnamed protein product [Effrenium voratum]
MSAMGVVLVLSDAVRDISRHHTQSVFLDDRVLVADTVREVLAAKQKWARWSRKLGLEENDQKVVALAQTQAQRLAFERRGLSQSQISGQLRILGVDYLSQGCDGYGSTRQQKTVQALGWRLARAPLPAEVRTSLYRSRIIPSLCWGWWFQDMPAEVFNQAYAVFRKVATVHHMAARNLRVIMDGHQLCPYFVAFAQAFTQLRSLVLKGLPWPGHGQRHSWVERVRDTLGAGGGGALALGRWTHPTEGNMDVQHDNKDKVLHLVRESWRRSHWEAFLAKDRRDSRFLRGTAYHPRRYKWAAEAFRDGGQHVKAVLTGAALSLSVQQVIFEGAVQQGCGLCGDAEAFPTWEHLAWDCAGFAARPARPGDPLSCRFGWPQRAGPPGRVVVEHLAAVREQVLGFRPHGRRGARL